MTQRVRDGLGLPAGFYRLGVDGTTPTFYAPNGITADGIASLVYANVVPVEGGYDSVMYDSRDSSFITTGSSNPSPAYFNNEALNFADDIIRSIFRDAHPEVNMPYTLETSDSRANIVGDLETLVADFTLIPAS